MLEDLPYVGEANTPQLVDGAGELLLYDDTMSHVYLPDAQAEERSALRLLRFNLKMELVGEAGDLFTILAQAPVSHTEMLLMNWNRFSSITTLRPGHTLIRMR